MDIELLKKKKEECRSWKNVQPWYNQLLKVFELDKTNLKVDYGDWFTIGKSVITSYSIHYTKLYEVIYSI